jgi:hypothetical protein
LGQLTGDSRSYIGWPAVIKEVMPAGRDQDEGEPMIDPDDYSKKLSDMAEAAGVAGMSESELRSYIGALEDRMLESKNPQLTKIIHAGRRARERSLHEDVPFAVLLQEELNDDKGDGD